MSPEFRRYYFVRRVTVLNLEPGQQHEHTTVQKHNRLFDSVLWQNWSSESIGGITHHTMVVWNGSLVHESTTNGSVTPGSMKLDISYNRVIHYAFMLNNEPTMTVTDGLAKTLLDPDHMGEQDDADVNINVA